MEAEGVCMLDDGRACNLGWMRSELGQQRNAGQPLPEEPPVRLQELRQAMQGIGIRLSGEQQSGADPHARDEDSGSSSGSQPCGGSAQSARSWPLHPGGRIGREGTPMLRPGSRAPVCKIDNLSPRPQSALHWAAVVIPAPERDF